MANRLGILAGSGNFPLLALIEAQNQGYFCAVAGFLGEADPALETRAEVFEWVGAGELAKLLAFLKNNGIREIILAGKVDPRSLYRADRFDEAAVKLLAQLKEKSPSRLVQALIGFLSGQGIEVMDPTFLLRRYFCPEGVLTESHPAAEIQQDIDFGWRKARTLADLDIGQTVVVKNGTVVAVEGVEGTDQVILRGGELAGPGIIAVKVSRTSQDPRVDLPGVGFKTIEALAKVRAAALCLEADRVVFFERAEALALANASHIAIVARK